MPLSLFMPIIPYFISVLLPENIPPIFVPVSTFKVEINTFLANASTDLQDMADASFNLKCQLIHNHSMRCYIPESSIHYMSTSNYITNNPFTHTDLNYSHINFTMEFDDTGLRTLDIEDDDVEDIECLTTLYEMIGDQLSIGTNIEWKGEEFHEMEETIIGECSTFYELLEAEHSSQLNYTLNIFNHDDYWKFLQKESVDLRKYRAVQDCCSNCSYILGMILWNDLFLTADFNVTMTTSKTQMLLDKHYFSSTTNNFFLLFDEKNKLMGRVEEYIKVTLLAVDTSEILCTSC